MALNSHTNEELLISKVLLPDGKTYEVHDASAIHDLSDLDIAAVLDFKGTKNTAAEVFALANAKKGHVYLVKANNTEYVYVNNTPNLTGEANWEQLGNIHDAASSTHKHTVTVAGTAEASTVTANGNITPSLNVTKKEITASAGAPTFTPTGADTALGTGATFSTSITGKGLGTVTKTGLDVTVGNVAVAENGTAKSITGITPTSTEAITGITPTTSTFVTDVNTASINNPTVTEANASKVEMGDDITVTKINSYGSASTWSFTVSNGTLTIAGQNSTTGSGTNYDIPHVASVTDVATSKVTTTPVTVATGAKGTASAVTGLGTPSKSTFLTGLGTPTTATVLTGVKVSTQPTVTLKAVAAGAGDVDVVGGVAEAVLSATTTVAQADTVNTISGGTVSAPTVTLTNASEVVTAVSGKEQAITVTGTAAASAVTASGTTSEPIN